MTIRSAVLRAPAVVTALAVAATRLDLNEVEGREFSLQIAWVQGNADSVEIQHFVSQDGITYVPLGVTNPLVAADVETSNITALTSTFSLAMQVKAAGYRWYQPKVMGIDAGGDFAGSSCGLTAFYEREGTD